MEFKLSPTAISLLIGGIGAITGIISLGWHILNSRSKVTLGTVSFTREHNQAEKEVIKISVNIRNRGNRSTTIEYMYIEIGNRIIPCLSEVSQHIEANSSKKLTFFNTFTPKEFKDILRDKNVRLGILIAHTFGTLRKRGWTDFSTDWLNL